MNGVLIVLVIVFGGMVIAALDRGFNVKGKVDKSGIAFEATASGRKRRSRKPAIKHSASKQKRLTSSSPVLLPRSAESADEDVSA